MQLSRAAPLNWTQLRSIVLKVARVSAFAPVGLVADEDELTCVESFLYELLAPGCWLEYAPVAGTVAVDPDEFDRSFALVGSVADDDALQFVESPAFPVALLECAVVPLELLG